MKPIALGSGWFAFIILRLLLTVFLFFCASSLWHLESEGKIYTRFPTNCLSYPRALCRMPISTHSESSPLWIYRTDCRESYESKLVKDSDNLEFIISLKEQFDIGNKRASSWIDAAVKRLKTKEAQELADAILKIDSDNWWFGDKKDSWWINRTKS